MVSFFSQSFHYDHPWQLVNIGVWRKYPNPHSAHVISVDVLDRSIDPSTGIVRTERVIGCKQKAPGWVVKVSRRPLPRTPPPTLVIARPSSETDAAHSFPFWPTLSRSFL
ncbi:hypothetical protein FRC20_004248 [Serendipita sp. 405]|nr:hypothetical protein FRC20_004248 [Serendipita sp. 405]